MMQRATYRNIQNGMLFLTIFVLMFSFYIEYIHQLQPCPLCVMQRLCVLLLGVLCMVALVLSSLHRAKIITLIQCVLAIAGMYFAGRQVWLQSLPISDQAAQCIPGMNALLHYFSWFVVIKSFVLGSGDCSRIDWRWLGISIPVWSMMYYSIVLIISGYLYVAIVKTLRITSKFKK